MLMDGYFHLVASDLPLPKLWSLSAKFAEGQSMVPILPKIGEIMKELMNKLGSWCSHTCVSWLDRQAPVFAWHGRAPSCGQGVRHAHGAELAVANVENIITGDWGGRWWEEIAVMFRFKHN
jgi:hypothetical protein